jgi:glycosyltransferase involved in cell wall biosynthesis
MLLEHMTRLGVRVTLYHTVRDETLEQRARSLDDLPAAVRARLESVLVPYPTGRWFPGHYLFDSDLYSTRLLHSFRQRDEHDPADFVYAQGLTGLAFIRARRAGEKLPPVGVNAHGYEMYQPCFGAKARLIQWMMRPQHSTISRNADLVFSFSGKIHDIVVRRIGTDPAKVEVIPNAVDGAWIAGGIKPSKSPRRFLFVGRFERRKGVQELSAALRTLVDVDWRMDFVGPIPTQEQLLDPRARYHGAIVDADRLIELYDSCDCIVCPSYAEGMPTVLIEAMARGLAVIATDVGASSELVDPSTGILLPEPRPELIANAIREIVSMPEAQLERLREAARAKASEYRWELVAARVIAAIRRRMDAGGWLHGNR